MDEREPDEACVSLSETVSQRQAMSSLGFFFLPGEWLGSRARGSLYT